MGTGVLQNGARHVHPPHWMWARAVTTCSSGNSPRFGGFPPTASIANPHRRRASVGCPRFARCSLHAPSISAVSGPSASGWACANTLQPAPARHRAGDRDQRRSTSRPPTSGPSRSAVGPRSCSHRRTAGAVRRHLPTCSSIGPGAAQDLLMPVDVPGGDGVAQRPPTCRGPPAPATPGRARRGSGLARDASRARRNAPNRWWKRNQRRRIVELDHEQVGGDHPLEDDRRVIRDRVTATAHRHRRCPAPTRRPGTRRGRAEGRQHLAQQEVADGTIGAGEHGQEVGAADAALQRDRRQLHPRRPSLRQLVQPFEVSGVDVDLVQSSKVSGQLIRANRRSSPRSSSSSPRSRHRANDNGGSALVPATNRNRRGTRR